jgi:hypothetical protein
MEAISDNSRAPKEQRIQNMDETNIVLEMALEMFLTEQTEHFRHALPVIYIDGKRYLILQTEFWNMERPLVGWLAQSELPADAKDDAAKDSDTILLGDDGTFMVRPETDKDEQQLMVNFQYFMQKRHFLEVNEGEARIRFFDENEYNQILSKFREYKAAKK